MNIEEVTEEEVSKNQDEYLDRVEKGEVFPVSYTHLTLPTIYSV